MKRMALFIDSYDSVRFQSLIDQLEHDAAILRQEAQHSYLNQNIDSLRRRRFSTIQQVQIYRSPPDTTIDPLLSRRRTEEELKLLMKGLANGIPWMVNLSLRNVSNADLVVIRDSGLFPQQLQDAAECVVDADGDIVSSTPPLERHRNRRVLSDLQGIFVAMAAGEGVDDGFLESLRRLPSLSSASFWIEPNVHFSFPSLLSRGTLPTPDNSPIASLKTLDIQQDKIMTGGSNRSSSNNQASRTNPPTVHIATHVIPLCQTLETSSCCLRSLNLDHDLCHEGLQLLTNMIQVNPTLKSLSISFCLPNDISNNEAILSFADALKRNNTLVHLQNHKASRIYAGHEVQQSLLDMLENDNYVLRVLDLCHEEEADNGADDRSVSFCSQKNLFLKLNFWGRQHYLAGGENRGIEQTAGSTDRSIKDDEAWIDLFHSIRDDLDCIFYFLSRNPSLVTNASQDTRRPPTRRPKVDEPDSTFSSLHAPPSAATGTEATCKSTGWWCDTDETYYTRPTKRIRQNNGGAPSMS
jgi:hypothetical protein